MFSRLGNIVTKNNRENIKKELYEIKNKKNPDRSCAREIFAIRSRIKF